VEPAGEVTQAPDVAQAVVIVEADGADIDMASPWGSGRAWTRTMAGLVVRPHRVLVGGWGLRRHKHVRVARQGSTTKSEARVLLFDEDAGLALLAVDDPAFSTGPKPASFGLEFPKPAPVRVLHAASEGARVEAYGAAIMSTGIYGQADLLHMKLGQVDPKFVAEGDVVGSGGRALGIVTAVSGSEVVAVSARALRDFLAAAERPTYDGFAIFGAIWQPTTSKALRDELGLADSEGGVRLTRVWAMGSAAGTLAAGDVVLTMDGRKIDRDGSYERPGVGRLPFHGALTGAHRPGDVIRLGILRDGQRQTVRMTLRAWPGRTDLVPWFAPESQASAYVIEGGLVFEALTGEYLRSFGDDWMGKVSPQLLDAWFDRLDATPERPGVVVLTRVLPDPATLGYERLHDLVIESINGVPVHTLADVTAGFEHANGPFHFVTLAQGQKVRRIVLDVREANAAGQRLKATYLAGTP
jgi:hypothetical protein